MANLMLGEAVSLLRLLAGRTDDPASTSINETRLIFVY